MPQLLVVDKTGQIKESKTTTTVSDLHNLAKKAGYKTADNFELVHSWKVSLFDENYKIGLYGKTTGRANQENKYEFPPPVDNVLFFGSCILVRINLDDSTLMDLSINEWDNIYEYLYGGFEELYEDTEDDVDEDTVEDECPRTKQGGYKKDGFVVDEDDDDDDDDDAMDSDDDHEENEVILHTKKTTPSSLLSMYYNCDNELTEEEYV